MSAKTTGAKPNGDVPNGEAKNRSHHDGSSSRTYTEEQKLAVIRVKKCGSTAFYDILGLESEKKTVDDSGIKRAYRKLSLLTHPDKNGYPGADDAFKMVSRAFQILSDPEKKKRYDQFGGDPDNRFSSSAASNPFSGFARSPGGMRQGGMFEEEISPEELFRQFFGGGLGGGFGGPFGGGIFDAGPGFVFNVGGGPGIRIHQFGGTRPRRRPPGARGPQPNDNEGQQPSAWSALQSLLPLIILLVLPLLSSLFSSGLSSSSTSRLPLFSLDKPEPPLTRERTSTSLRVNYYVNPADVASYGPKEWRKLDDAVDRRLLGQLERECHYESREQERMVQEAQGWFFPDEEKLAQARNLPMRSCKRYNALIRGYR